MTNTASLKAKGTAGFSLVELMVVVAIIGILASIAVPQFQKFTFKARVTEAKAGLTSLYTAEKAFYGEWSEYDTRFGAIGYAPEGNYYFNIGFGATVASDAFQLANGFASGTDTLPGAGGGAAIYVTVATYCAGAGNSSKCTSMPTSTAITATVPPGISGFTGNISVVNTASPATFMAAAMAAPSMNPEGGTNPVAFVINQSKMMRGTVP